jgi:hypothetical protein
MKDVDPLSFLKAVYMNVELPLSVRMRAAIELLPYSYPKLAVVAQVTENDIAVLLDRRIKRYEEMKVIEATNGNRPQIDQPIERPQIEPSPRPMARTLDRRYRRL